MAENTSPKPKSLLTPDRDRLRTFARRFIDGHSFEDYYGRAHMPQSLWLVGQLLRCLTIVGLRNGIVGLLNTRKQCFSSERLRQRYRELPDRAVVVRGHIVINNEKLGHNPNAAAPALIVACLQGAEGSDAHAGWVCDQIVDRIHLAEPETPVERQVAQMIADEEYVACRKRLLPLEFTQGIETHLVDVHIDNRLLPGGQFFRIAESCFLIDPTPNGLVMLIPQEGVLPPPLHA